MEENRNESVNDIAEYILENYKDNTIKESSELYDDKKDFTSFETWMKCREAKLFFYYEILLPLPSEERFNLSFQIRKASVITT